MSRKQYQADNTIQAKCGFKPRMDKGAVSDINKACDDFFRRRGMKPNYKTHNHLFTP